MSNSRLKAIDFANWFLGNIDREAGDSITHLKLQKILYYAQAWALSLPNINKPLFSEDFQAWAHGPVLRTIFDEFKGNNWDSLPPPKNMPKFNAKLENFLREILDVYNGFSAKELEKMTHAETPWKEARGNLPPEARSNNIICKEKIREFYSQLLVDDGLDVEEA